MSVVKIYFTTATKQPVEISDKFKKEFEIYRQREMRQLESDFDKAVKQLTKKESK